MRALTAARAVMTGVVGLSCWLASAANATACECVGYASACATTPQTRAVFVGRVTGFSAGEVLFEVERGIRGVKRGPLRLDSGAGNCKFIFRVGERYVVYAFWDQALGSLSTSMCSRTRQVSSPRAQGDLAYFDVIDHHVAPAVVTGIVYDATDVPSFVHQPRPLPGIVVSAIPADGRHPRTTVTGADGSYVFTGMPAGKWTIAAALPRTFESHDRVTVILRENDECAEADVRARPRADPR